MTEDDRGWLRKLRHTPPIDLLRGRVTGRWDDRFELLGAGLPPEVVEAICKTLNGLVCSRARYGRIKGELAAHFRLGMEAGWPIEQLVASFGRPRQIRGALRRVIARDQPLPARVIVWLVIGLAWLINAVAGVYLLTLVVALNDKPRIRVDYLAALNAPALAVEPEDRAWPGYRDAMLGDEENDLRELLDTRLVEAGEYLSRQPMPGEPGWGMMEQIAEAHSGIIEAVRAATAKPGLGYRLGYAWQMDERDWAMWSGGEPQPEPPEHWTAEETLFSLMPIHLSVLHNTAKWLSLDMLVRAEQGNGQAVVDDYWAVMRAAGHAYEQRMTLDRLVAAGMVAEANRSLAFTLVDRPRLFDEAQLESLLRIAVLGRDVIDEPHDAEWLLVRDAIQRQYGPGGRYTIAGLRWMLYDSQLSETTNKLAIYPMLPVAYWLMPTHGQLERLIDMLRWMQLEDEATPLWVLLQKPTDYQQTITRLRDSPCGIVRYGSVILPVSGNSIALKTVRSVQTHTLVLQAAIALELYRREHGEYPGSLEALAPRWLSKAPIDTSTGKPLIYHIVEGRVVIYGRGLDGDDDGGVRGHDPEGKLLKVRWPGNVPEDGDWLLWPPTIEPIATEPREGEGSGLGVY